MDPPRKNLPSEVRRSATIEAVIDLAGVQNPSEITTAANGREIRGPGSGVTTRLGSDSYAWQSPPW